MSGHEIFTRTRQEAGKRADLLLYRFGLDPFRAGSNDYDARGPFFRDAAEVPRIFDVFRGRFPAEADALVARAERILTRRFDLLGYRDLDFGRDIDWSLDPVHGKRAPALPWPAVPFLDFNQVGDHKIIWELNRHQFLVTLAKAYRLTGNARFAAALQELWYGWQRKNPYPLGINWASTLEVAFRAASWMWAAFLLEGTPADSAAFQRHIASTVARAGWYIERFLSTYFSPNTHLLGEGVVLFLIGARYPGLHHAARWRSTGWDITLEQSRRQVRADGMHFEQSTYYHVYALDFFLHARAMAERSALPVPKDFDAVIRRMAAALTVLSQAGALPRYGDDDGGRLFDPSRNTAAQMLDPLSTAAVLFRDSDFKTASPGLTEETLWLLGPESAAAFDALPSVPKPLHSAALPASGIYTMVSAGPPPAQLFLDAGEQGWAGAGHGHADTLGLQLAAAGRLWLTDPGTCAYVGEGGVRDDFRGTPAHNTLVVDGVHQAEPAGPFAWADRPVPELCQWIAAEASGLFDARHSGYRRLPSPVTHRRQVLRFGPACWLVRDIAEGSGVHTLDIRWHFAPDLVVITAGPAVVAHSPGESLTLLPASDPAWAVAMETAPYSPVYGVSVPAPLVRWSYHGPLPAEFAVVIGFDPYLAVSRLVRVASEQAYELRLP